MLIEGAVACTSLLRYVVFGGSVYASQVLFGVCKYDVFVRLDTCSVFAVVDCSLFLSTGSFVSKCNGCVRCCDFCLICDV